MIPNTKVNTPKAELVCQAATNLLMYAEGKPLIKLCHEQTIGFCYPVNGNTVIIDETLQPEYQI